MSNDNKDFWLLKLNALLHDPPNKPVDIKGHEAKSKDFAETLGIGLTKQDFKEADWIASAADRLNFPSFRAIGGANFKDKPYLSHPLAGTLLNLGKGRLKDAQIDGNLLQRAIRESLADVPLSIKNDHQKLFLWLWRNWSAQIQKTEGNQLGSLWDLLPADTRIPDHSIWAHQSLTSAIAATANDQGEPNPAFLLFTIGPVQTFISAARRTQDLWAGSYLLSFLNWTAIQVIAEEFGPDAIIFPNLVGQPLCDRWLNSKDSNLASMPSPKDLILPSLPNRFLAIVPAHRGKELAQKAAKQMRSQWQEISDSVKIYLERELGYNPNWSNTWQSQTENIFETYWQVYPWRPTGKEPIQDYDFKKFVDPHRDYLGERYTEITKILKIYEDDTDTYKPNIGAIYSDLYFITEKSLGARKSLRNFPQVSETGEKSTLAGERAAMRDQTSNQTVKEFWYDLAGTLRSKGIYEIQEGGGERLDAIELTKRFAWRSFFKDQEGYETENGQDGLRFPSTSSVSTAKFKSDIINSLKKPNSQNLDKAIKAWIDSIPPEIRQQNTVRKDVIPYLAKIAEPLIKTNKYVMQFLKLDGRLLFTETYEEDVTLKSLGSNTRATLDALKDFLSCASKEFNISKPRKYFAVLMMDGDNMGEWISGAKMPKYESVLHPDTLSALKQRSDWDKILENPRLMSPAIHGFISKALGDFSLKLVRHIVETRYPGKLVYAGGDDVLAFLPLDVALKVARELRAAFSGEIYTGEIGTDDECKKFDVTFEDSAKGKSGYIWLELENEKELLSTMGSKATASTGIAIAHHTQPLEMTLQEVRKAEKAAKSSGRNGFSLTFLKRSGEIMSAGAKWYYSESLDEKNPDKSLDTVELLLEFQEHFECDRISSKFPYVLREQAITLAELEIEEIYAAEIKRLLHRQQGKNKLSKKEEESLANEVAKRVTRANIGSKHQLKTFADLLVFARFLATGEGEE